MSIYDSPYYDEPRSWIQKKRAQNLDWETIRMAKKKSTSDLAAFLNTQHEDNDWPKLSIDDWDSLVNECQDVEAQQESILFRGNDGALFDRSQDNNLKIPENPRSCWQLYKSSLKWKEQSIANLEVFSGD